MTPPPPLPPPPIRCELCQLAPADYQFNLSTLPQPITEFAAPPGLTTRRILWRAMICRTCAQQVLDEHDRAQTPTKRGWVGVDL